ncbi:unnamed protein product (macronuclear) [Paramecium tetraurelia]|uniref:Uncharacterized protein n=1 Tax=Paramecium tetraurelia TaxID=5888 RepID=A0BX50_PARTE|nr:uncharacterized protein GSPATT00032969001 [Paramecium tetraurelia]CAK63117.1 unnamed protein product [Paramecium tetraurelia]|eukprot:XP_001430515.1 hypothetical protein (macronuclear) [Paramecium tetraurelia strain d4-2]
MKNFKDFPKISRSKLNQIMIDMYTALKDLRFIKQAKKNQCLKVEMTTPDGQGIKNTVFILVLHSQKDYQYIQSKLNLILTMLSKFKSSLVKHTDLQEDYNNYDP